jgi:uroporphyrinogen decarboxylase
MVPELIQCLRGEKTAHIPFWFMRQAGRYLPEYRELRQHVTNFLDFCYTPDAATEVTLQPIRRFGMSAAIIFSDILVVPHALGMEVWFEQGEGPKLVPARDEGMLTKLSLNAVTDKLQPVYQALKQTRAALAPETALIGFCGSPWTLACYAVEGGSSKDFAQVKAMAAANRAFFSKLISLFTDAVIVHAQNQINAGAQVIQLFDSWSGILNEQEFADWVIAPTKKIVRALKHSHPDTPIIGFPRQSGIKTLSYVQETGVDAVSIDGAVPLDWARGHLQPLVAVQGALGNMLLADNKTAMLAEARRIVETLGHKPFVFNLAHGILPHTPLENMQALCEYLKTVTYQP